MLQSYHQNEQVGSLPKSLAKNQSRSGFIAVNRPDSAQLVDLHIYIIPKSVWKNVQHLAQNAAMDDAVSVGFVRVPPDAVLSQLRKSIERLCTTEINFPRDFIFLRSVGRCLTRVKPAQENELKVKHYRPPMTFAPEIYILEGRHEDYSYTPSTTPTETTINYVFGTRYQHRLNLDDYNRSISQFSSNYPGRLIFDEKKHTPFMNGFDFVPSYLPASRQDSIKDPRMDLDMLTPNLSGPTTLRSRKTPSLYRELIKLQEEQERLRQRQEELQRIRRDFEEKKINSQHEEEIRRRREEEKADAERLRQKKAEAERLRLEQETRAATKIQASYRGFKDRKKYQKIRRNAKRTDIPSSLSKTLDSNQLLMDCEEDISISDDDFSDGSQILSITSSIKSTSDVDSNSSRAEETTSTKKQDFESLDSHSCLSRTSSASSAVASSASKIERKIQSDKIVYSKPKGSKNMDFEITRSATVTKGRYFEQEFSTVTLPNINDEGYELETEAQLRKQLEEQRRRIKELEENQSIKEYEEKKKQKPSQRKLRDDPESLQARLEQIRNERLNLEKTHNDIIRKLRQMHGRITSRRREARDMWKKKYYRERKKTLPLEENSALLKTELSQINTKIMQSIENEAKQAAHSGNVQLAEMGNLIAQITRIQREIQTTRDEIDSAKLRLTTDIKLKNQAENECRTLKEELGQAKMNLNHIRNRITF